MPEITTHLEGLGFPEGPVELVDGRIAFVDLRDRTLRYYDPVGGGVETVAEFPGSPNGLRLGPDGALYVANNGGVWPMPDGTLRFAEPQHPGAVHRVEPVTGEWAEYLVELDLADFAEFADGPLRPNDLVFDTDGTLYFTDPRNWEVIPDFERFETGRLYAVTPDGRARVVATVDGFCNGLAFHPDGSLLVGLSYANRIVRFPRRPDGGFDPAEDWSVLDEHMAPDGMILAGDRLIVTGSRGDEVQVLDLSGRVLERVPLGAGSDPTNVCVAHGRVWVTLGYPGTLVSWAWEG
ncbi:SMP-30/gluconolactonase/LRE family protein [Herbiconiux sp. A18JL235]|uniref:SMP-30/gluconolactonase/LRE family protein n=1 Tax=Herbiconiux sp. A18JL235 TaxID=3152363 RepID=A0AB39BE95_9MICO